MFNRVSTMSTICTECDVEFSRKDAMVRHKRNRHGTTHPYPPPPPPLTEGYTPPPPPPPQSNEEEPYYILKTNNPFLFWVPDGNDPDHFMPWVHPFTSVILGPTERGKSVFVSRFVHNIKHMMISIPDRILW